MSDTLDGPFLDVADSHGGGKDHCEFVGQTLIILYSVTESQTSLTVYMGTLYPLKLKLEDQLSLSYISGTSKAEDKSSEIS